MIRTLVLVTVLAASAGPIAAQQRVLPSVPQQLSLSDAVELAVAQNPTYRQATNDRGPAAWSVRNAYAAFLPEFTASGGLQYRGSGSQNFLATAFAQPSATVGTDYSLSLSMQLSGRTLMQPGVARANLEAAEATIDGARINLESFIRQQYVTVLESQAQVELAELQLRRNEEFFRLAQARFNVGQNTRLDVRQAEVARGQAEVALLQARQRVIVEKLRLFQQMGVPAPEDPSVVTLTDSFPIVAPAWQLGDLLAEAGERNPDLESLRALGAAARASERAAKSGWLPSLSLSAGWSGFTQQFTNLDPLIQNAVTNARQDAINNQIGCDFTNQALLNPGVQPLDCSAFQFTDADADQIAQQLRLQNSVFPFDFTTQPFFARMTVSLPIFTQFRRPLEVSEAAARSDDAREAVRARELQVRTDVSQAYYALQTAFESIGIQENNREAAQDQLRLATERYRVGSGTFFELLDAQLAAQRAEADYITAVYTYHRAIAALEAAVGRALR